MWRNVALVITSLALGGAAPSTPTQHETTDRATQPLLTQQIIRQNPVIQALLPVDEELASEVILKLQRITTGMAVPGSRGDASPSSAELAQINANPAFAQAYQHDLEETLALLRWVNSEIALGRQQRVHGLR